MKFQIGDIVRVVTATANPFWGYTGKVIEAFDGDLMDGQVFYRIKVSVLNTDEGVLVTMPLLFHESWLAYAGE